MRGDHNKPQTAAAALQRTGPSTCWSPDPRSQVISGSTGSETYLPEPEPSRTCCTVLGCPWHLADEIEQLNLTLNLKLGVPECVDYGRCLHLDLQGHQSIFSVGTVMNWKVEVSLEWHTLRGCFMRVHHAWCHTSMMAQPSNGPWLILVADKDIWRCLTHNKTWRWQCFTVDADRLLGYSSTTEILDALGLSQNWEPQKCMVFVKNG